VTTTDEILALAVQRAGEAIAVTQADIAAFRAASARGSASSVVRALVAACPAAGGPAWTAWLAAAAVAAGETALASDERPAAAPRPAWCAVFGAAVALADRPGRALPEATVTAAIAAGLGAAAIIESGLDDWGGWSSGTVAAAIGAGLTAGLLLGLAEQQLRAAIGLCATQAAGLRAAAGTDAFALQVGKAAFNGVEAALLARAGLTAPAEPLDGRRGLFALFGG
jgi:2-methylcitrate dehydratase PrpD